MDKEIENLKIKIKEHNAEINDYFSRSILDRSESKKRRLNIQKNNILGMLDTHEKVEKKSEYVRFIWDENHDKEEDISLKTLSGGDYKILIKPNKLKNSDFFFKTYEDGLEVEEEEEEEEITTYEELSEQQPTTEVPEDYWGRETGYQQEQQQSIPYEELAEQEQTQQSQYENGDRYQQTSYEDFFERDKQPVSEYKPDIEMPEEEKEEDKREIPSIEEADKITGIGLGDTQDVEPIGKRAVQEEDIQTISREEQEEKDKISEPIQEKAEEELPSIVKESQKTSQGIPERKTFAPEVEKEKEEQDFSQYFGTDIAGKRSVRDKSYETISQTEEERQDLEEKQRDETEIKDIFARDEDKIGAGDILEKGKDISEATREGTAKTVIGMQKGLGIAGEKTEAFLRSLPGETEDAAQKGERFIKEGADIAGKYIGRGLGGLKDIGDVGRFLISSTTLTDTREPTRRYTERPKSYPEGEEPLQPEYAEQRTDVEDLGEIAGEYARAKGKERVIETKQDAEDFVRGISLPRKEKEISPAEYLTGREGDKITAKRTVLDEDVETVSPRDSPIDRPYMKPEEYQERRQKIEEINKEIKPKIEKYNKLKDKAIPSEEYYGTKTDEYGIIDEEGNLIQPGEKNQEVAKQMNEIANEVNPLINKRKELLKGRFRQETERRGDIAEVGQEYGEDVEEVQEKYTTKFSEASPVERVSATLKRNPLSYLGVGEGVKPDTRVMTEGTLGNLLTLGLYDPYKQELEEAKGKYYEKLGTSELPTEAEYYLQPGEKIPQQTPRVTARNVDTSEMEKFMKENEEITNENIDKALEIYQKSGYPAFKYSARPDTSYEQYGRLTQEGIRGQEKPIGEKLEKDEKLTGEKFEEKIEDYIAKQQAIKAGTVVGTGVAGAVTPAAIGALSRTSRFVGPVTDIAQYALPAAYAGRLGYKGYDIAKKYQQGKPAGATSELAGLGAETLGFGLGLSYYRGTGGRPFGRYGPEGPRSAMPASRTRATKFGQTYSQRAEETMGPGAGPISKYLGSRRLKQFDIRAQQQRSMEAPSFGVDYGTLSGRKAVGTPAQRTLDATPISRKRIQRIRSEQGPEQYRFPYAKSEEFIMKPTGEVLRTDSASFPKVSASQTKLGPGGAPLEPYGTTGIVKPSGYTQMPGKGVRYSGEYEINPMRRLESYNPYARQTSLKEYGLQKPYRGTTLTSRARVPLIRYGEYQPGRISQALRAITPKKMLRTKKAAVGGGGKGTQQQLKPTSTYDYGRSRFAPARTGPSKGTFRYTSPDRDYISPRGYLPFGEGLSGVDILSLQGIGREETVDPLQRVEQQQRLEEMSELATSKTQEESQKKDPSKKQRREYEKAQDVGQRFKQKQEQEKTTSKVPVPERYKLTKTVTPRIPRPGIYRGRGGIPGLPSYLTGPSLPEGTTQDEKGRFPRAGTRVNPIADWRSFFRKEFGFVGGEGTRRVDITGEGGSYDIGNVDINKKIKRFT